QGRTPRETECGCHVNAIFNAWDCNVAPADLRKLTPKWFKM
ncbi:MAG: hypothetical protein ACI814_003431, partial [Mariniblastus sp.]